jgi:hypothetical protein
MQFRHGIFVADRKRERVVSNDSFFWNFAEYATGLTRIYPFANYTEIFIITRAFIRVAFEAQCLQIGQVILTAVLPGSYMVNLNSSFIRRDAA